MIKRRPKGGCKSVILNDGACLDLSLSDKRSYLHGGDLLDVLVQTFGIKAPVTLRIFKLSDSKLEICNSDPPATDRRAAFLAVEHDGRTQGYWMSRRADELITKRSDLSDADLLSGADITQARASMANPDPARMARIAVLLAIALLRKVHPGAKWLLGDISCRCYFAPVACVSVKLHHDSFRFVSLSVDVDGADWGRLVLVRSQEGTMGDAQQP